jgi:hypothetical protein
MDGLNALAYAGVIPVRELALYIEESLFRGTKWSVFEPNPEPLSGDMAKPPQTA